MTTELVVATPLLLLLILAVVQFAIWQHANHIADATANEALAAARAEHASAATGNAQAELVLDHIRGGSLVDPHVTVGRGGETVTVRVSGSARRVLPWLDLPINAEAHGPVERFVPAEGGRP